MNNIKETFSIKDLENISGIKAHTIRIWEKRYNLLSPNRTDTNIRHYSSRSLQKLLNVVLLNQNNYKISKIAEMSDETIKLKSKELVLKNATNNEAINTLKIAMFEFNNTLFNNTYNNLLQRKTFREIFKEVFIPFLNHIGLLWQTDTLLPAHEHFISNLITRKIQINIDKLECSTVNSDTTYILFLPENEIHELGLMYLNYELTLRGHRTIYLGQNLPLNNLNHFIKSEDSICFITCLTVQPNNDKVINYFEDIENALKNTNHQLIAMGEKTNYVKDLKFESNITLYPSLLEVLNQI